MAKVERRHRLAAWIALDPFHYPPQKLSGADEWVETGNENGWGLANEAEVAQSLADLEQKTGFDAWADGRAKALKDCAMDECDVSEVEGGPARNPWKELE